MTIKYNLPIVNTGTCFGRTPAQRVRYTLLPSMASAHAFQVLLYIGYFASLEDNLPMFIFSDNHSTLNKECSGPNSARHFGMLDSGDSC